MEIDYTVQIWREGEQYVAHAMPLDVASSGRTPDAARVSLLQALTLFLETAQEHGRFAEVLEDAGYEFDGVKWRCPECISFQRCSTSILH